MSTKSTRKPILAVIASLVMPGMGQIYNGQTEKGIFILVLMFFLIPASPFAAWISLLGSPHHIMLISLLFAVASGAIYLYSILNAGYTAKRLGTSYTLQSINQPYTYIITLIIGSFIFVGLFHFTKTRLIQSVHVPSKSMLPNIMPGDFLFIDKRVNCITCKRMLQKGDIILFYQPGDHHNMYLRRIVGMPGDKISINGSDIIINSRNLQTDPIKQFEHSDQNRLLSNHRAFREHEGNAVYIVLWKKQAIADTSKVYSVPAGTVFVLADNRSSSRDSREFGMIPMRDIIGIARQSWFSYSKNTGIRWWRIGRSVDALSSE